MSYSLNNSPAAASSKRERKTSYQRETIHPLANPILLNLHLQIISLLIFCEW
jgi:hypothetical protein